MRVALIDRPIDVAALVAEVAHPGTGATTLFVGTVRDQHAGRAVTGIDYDAYAPMAHRECETIGAEAAERFGTDRIVVEHRLGTLAVTEMRRYSIDRPCWSRSGASWVAAVMGFPLPVQPRWWRPTRRLTWPSSG